MIQFGGSNKDAGCDHVYHSPAQKNVAASSLDIVSGILMTNLWWPRQRLFNGHVLCWRKHQTVHDSLV